MIKTLFPSLQTTKYEKIINKLINRQNAFMKIRDIKSVVGDWAKVVQGSSF